MNSTGPVTDESRFQVALCRLMNRLFDHFQKEEDLLKLQSTPAAIDILLGNRGQRSLGPEIYRKIAGVVPQVPSMRELFIGVGWVWITCCANYYKNGPEFEFDDKFSDVVKEFINTCFSADLKTQTAMREEFRILLAVMSVMVEFIYHMANVETQNNSRKSLREAVEISNTFIEVTSYCMFVGFDARFKYHLFRYDKEKREHVKEWHDATTQLIRIKCPGVSPYEVEKAESMDAYYRKLQTFAEQSTKLIFPGSLHFERLSVEFARIYAAIAKECDRLGLVHNKNSKQ